MHGELTRTQPHVLQIVGLPGSGKTTGIRHALEAIECQVTHLDIQNYNLPSEYDRLAQDIRNAPSLVLLESACGIRGVRAQSVVHVKVPFALACWRCENRDGRVDYDYMSLLQTQLIPWELEVADRELPSVLKNLVRAHHEGI